MLARFLYPEYASALDSESLKHCPLRVGNDYKVHIIIFGPLSHLYLEGLDFNYSTHMFKLILEEGE